MVKETGKLTRNVIGPKIVLVQSNKSILMKARSGSDRMRAPPIFVLEAHRLAHSSGTMWYYTLLVLFPIIAAQQASKSNSINTFRLKNYSLHLADITIPPQSVNISINGVAEFNCTAVANAFSWRANGQEIISGKGFVITYVFLALYIRMSTLRMMVSSTDNATNITCLVISLSPFSFDISDPALLLVQGSYFNTHYQGMLYKLYCRPFGVSQ